MTENCVVLAIMDMVSSKSDVNGAKKKYVSGNFELKSDKNPKIMFKKSRIRETPTLSTDADNRNYTILERLHDFNLSIFFLKIA